jgi:hypothetical protein
MSKRPSGWFEHYERGHKIRREMAELNEKRNLIPSNNRMKKVTVEFDDDFAPISQKLVVSANTLLTEPQKYTLYGHNWFKIGMAAIEFAKDLGFPYLEWPLLGQFTRITKEEYIALCGMWAEHIENYPEHSEEWICLLIYFRLVQVSHHLSQNSPIDALITDLIILGGLVRELELSKTNRKDSLDRKKSKRNLVSNPVGRNETNARKQATAKEWREHAKMILGSLRATGTNTAIAHSIFNQWNKFGDEEQRPKRPATKTILNWLSSEKPSHTAISAGN